MEALFALFIGFLFGNSSCQERHETAPISLLKKWSCIVNYKSDTCPPLPINDKLWVATLLEEAEQYCLRCPDVLDENGVLIEKRRMDQFVGDIRKNYKNRTWDFTK